jgi:transcriptional regulator with XRE-family HTH domain
MIFAFSLDGDYSDSGSRRAGSRTYISKLENGKIEPGLRALKTLADSFGMLVSQLLKGV